MSDFEKYWEENASKESWANKAVAWNIWKEKQAIINDLKAQLNNMEACYIEKKKQVEGALHILDELYRKGLFKKPTAVSEAIEVLRGANE